MSTQRFCLRWNNHQSNLLSVFDQLLHDESFVDVTLAVDGRYLKAHKIVLSACSPYFQALFVGHPDRHPIVILKDIPYVDMRSLLDFMYRGEVSVDQDRLTLFLKVAESLRIKGLTEVNEDQCDLPKIASSLLSNPVSAGSMSLSYQQRLKRPLSSSQHSLNSSSSSNLQSNNPLLGSALTGPKRKRGLPRKLSGSLAANLDLIPNKPQLDDRLDDDDDRRLGIDPSQFLGRDEDELDEDEEFDEEEEQRSGGLSDSDMIERADSPFDNKMLEVNMSEGGGKESKQPQHRNPSTEEQPPSEDKEDREPSSPSLSKGGREEDNPSPGPTGDVKPSDAAQLLAANVKQEREASETTSGGDQNETNPSPTPPERFPPGLLRLIPRSELISKDKLVESSNILNKKHKTNGNSGAHFDNLNLLKSLIMNNNVDDGGGNGGMDENKKQFLSQLSTEHKFIFSQLEQLQKNSNGNFSLHAQSQHIHQMLTNNNHANGGMNENQNFMSPERNAAGTAKRRIRRRATSSSDPTESLTEMSVRGLNLFRYASVTEGIYKCMECAKVDVIKTFKNKYSFQRHAFLYHEGCQRKVFPCPICGKEFSRPDKMKNHMKTVHDCFMPATTPQRGNRPSLLAIDFAKEGVFNNKDLVHNLSIFATNNNAGVPVNNGPSTAALPLVPFYLPP
uniref:Protein tramtrack, alpha isoform n=1 Tax=Cacopsylla melanoneura TaxID=428564 RepID=A0A8D9BL35_9HEMI